MAAWLNQYGVLVQAFGAWALGIVMDSNFGDAKLLPESSGLVRKCFDSLDQNIIAVVTNFIGHSFNVKIRTLGLGGLDLIATHIGATLG